MVQITHALVRDDETGKLVKIAADKFDKKTDGKKTAHCPDKGCGCEAVLTHYNTYMQTFYDLDTGEAYKLKIPAHFKRSAHSPLHDLSCTAVDAYTIYQNYARDLGGLSQQHGAFVYNLNIMTNTRRAPVRPRKVISPEFEAAVPVRENNGGAKNGHGHANGNGHVREKVKLSEGLNHVSKLAGLLDHTEFDKHYRDSIILRDGRKRYTLGNLYEDDAVRLFRTAHARAKSGADVTPVLLQFKPIVMPAYHNKNTLTIQGQAATVRGADGKDYSVSVLLHCGSKDIYQAMKKEIRAGERSFLLYAESARVDLIEFAMKKKEIQEGRANDRAVFVHVRIDTSQQVKSWKPYNGQLDLEEAGMDLPVQRKPPREIPQSLTV